MNYEINTLVTFDKRTNPEAFKKACEMFEALDREVEKQPKNYYGLNVNSLRYEKAAEVLGYKYTNKRTDGCLVIKEGQKKVYFPIFETVSVKDIREEHGLSRAEFCRQTGIPIRTVEDWDAGKSKPSEWVVKLIKFYLDNKK